MDVCIHAFTQARTQGGTKGGEIYWTNYKNYKGNIRVSYYPTLPSAHKVCTIKYESLPPLLYTSFLKPVPSHIIDPCC